MSTTSETLQAIHRDLGRLEGKLDTVLALEPRVSSLERAKSWLLGAAAAVSAVVSIGTPFITGR